MQSAAKAEAVPGQQDIYNKTNRLSVATISQQNQAVAGTRYVGFSRADYFDWDGLNILGGDTVNILLAPPWLRAFVSQSCCTQA